MNPVDLELRMGEKSVTDAITRNYQVADALNITSTPNFIIGDEILRGAVGIDEDAHQDQKHARLRQSNV